MGTFIKKLIEINEGLTSYQNITSSFNINDKTPLQLIQIYKKMIDYLNQELKEMYGKEHTDFFLVTEDLNARINLIDVDISDINEYFNDQINFNKLKQNLIKKFKKIYQISGFEKKVFINIIENKILPKIIISIYNRKFSQTNLLSFELNNKSNNFNNESVFRLFLHDFVLHTSLDKNVIYKFDLKDEEGKPLYLPLIPKEEDISKSVSAKKYSPEDVLYELYSLLTNFLTFNSKIHYFLINNLDHNKLHILLSKDNDNEKKIISKLNEISDYMERSTPLSKEDIQLLIKKINSTENKQYKHLNLYNLKILYSTLNKMTNKFNPKDYEIDFISLLKNADYFTKDSTFKDFRQYFINYPNLLKIFKNFKEEQKIFELNKQDSEKVILLVSRSIHVLNSLLKNNKKNIEERLPKINFLIKRIGQLIDNTRSDNFISLLSKELN